MQMHSSERVAYSAVEGDCISRNEHSYNGSTMHTMKPHDFSQPKINYNQNLGNASGGYNNYGNKGQMGYSSETRYEEERRHSGWGGKDTHLAHGGYGSHQGHNGHHNGGYGAHQGHSGHHNGGYGAHQGHNGHHNGGYGAHQGHNGAHNGGYGAHQGHNGHHNGGYGAHQGHNGGYGDHHGSFGPVKKVSFWEYKGIDD